MMTAKDDYRLFIAIELPSRTRAALTQLQAKLAQLPPVNLKETAQAVCISQFWLDLSEIERRFYFREFIQKIEIVRDGKDWTLDVIFIF